MKNKRIFWIDAVRALSIFLVVVIHVSAITVLKWGSITTSAWETANLFNSLSRISVPLFVMLSGVLLLQNKDTLESFLRKRFKRILLPWFFWGILLILVNNNFSINRIVNGDTKAIILSNYFSGFWFMPMLAGIYLITPFVKPFIQKAKQNEFKYFFSLWFLSASLIPTLNKLFNISLNINLTIWLTYLGYFVAGFYIDKKVKLNKFKYLQIKLLFLINLYIVFVGTYAYSTSANQFIDYFYNYVSVPVVIMSLSGFIILKNNFSKIKLNSKKVELVNFFSNHSFGIFLSHALIIKLLEKQLISLSLHPVISIPLISIIIFISSSFVIASLKKIRVIKEFAG